MIARVAIACAALVLAASPALAEWREVLAIQLLVEEDCVVVFYTNVRETEVDGRAALFARAHCEDLRTFDVDRVGEAKGFRIEVSGVQNC